MSFSFNKVQTTRFTQPPLLISNSATFDNQFPLTTFTANNFRHEISSWHTIYTSIHDLSSYGTLSKLFVGQAVLYFKLGECPRGSVKRLHNPLNSAIRVSRMLMY